MLRGEFADRVLSVAGFVDQVWHAGVGLVPWRGVEINIQHNPEMERAAYESGYIWGGVIFTSRSLEPSRYEPESNALSFRERRFPIIIHHARHEPEVKEIHDPHGCLGTAASWARMTDQNRNNAKRDGFITAEHVVAPGVRNFDLLENGQKFSAQAVKYAPPCLDTAFVDATWPSSRPGDYTPQPYSNVATGDPVQFDGATTSSVSGFVTHISAHVKYSGSGVPMILCHDGLGAPGDSGALVEVYGEPTAMHLGKIDLDSGGQESRGIFLQQICRVMDVELFR